MPCSRTLKCYTLNYGITTYIHVQYSIHTAHVPAYNHDVPVRISLPKASLAPVECTCLVLLELSLQLGYLAAGLLQRGSHLVGIPQLGVLRVDLLHLLHGRPGEGGEGEGGGCVV